MTSSARPSSVIGKVMSSTLAVFMLITSSIFVDCQVGGLLAVEDAADMAGGQAIGFGEARAVSHEPPGIGEIADGRDGRIRIPHLNQGRWLIAKITEIDAA
jgi:hypothetical protein